MPRSASECCRHGLDPPVACCSRARWPWPALVAVRPAHADLVVPAGAVVSLSSGVVDLGCTDVVVAGTLLLGDGSVQRTARDHSGGRHVDGGSV